MFVKVVTTNISQFIDIRESEKIKDLVENHKAKIECDEDGYVREYNESDVAKALGVVKENYLDTETLGIKFRPRAEEVETNVETGEDTDFVF